MLQSHCKERRWRGSKINQNSITVIYNIIILCKLSILLHRVKILKKNSGHVHKTNLGLFINYMKKAGEEVTLS
jgi:hypothetical protein